MKRILTGVVMGVILIAACALTAVIVAKNRTLSVGIRAATSGMGDASVSDLGDVEPYPVIEFAEKHAYDLGGQAYLWFYGRWRMILEERDFVLKNGAEINSLLKYRDPPTSDDEIYVTPNLDVLNIVSFFDLSEQPQILTIPPVEDGRYYTFMFVDAWHNIIANVSRQHYPQGGQQVALVGPDWQGELPEGAIRLDSPTNTVALLGRIRVSPEIPEDVAKAQSILDAVQLAPLSATMDVQVAENAVPGQSYELIDPNARQTLGIFDNYREILRRNPPYGKDAYAADIFEEIIPGAGLAPNPVFMAGLKEAAQDSQRMIRTSPMASRLRGWSMTPPEVSTPDWSWLLRAALTEYGILVNVKEESVYITTTLDSDRKSMTGGESYELRLASPPPVKEFWSVTLYDMATAQLIANDWDKFRIGDNTPGLKYEADGSLRLFISPEPPEDADYVPNWIPSTKDKDIQLNIVMRIYGPTDEILSKEWFPENWKRQ
ncbi:DUF1254 domain-containing protein [Hyphomonas jannaschiana]|uniref:Lipoprotein n=1 Tax=Hyphomonas jannaschiana VP2 TaxID=1280952 RepID=A0A059FEU3_9PROT|nr:DUF1254 domain-containing protein [Hyphomonas jannaschiana]KCZ89122.1 hypothetical protein HJA_07492 [Hyphomonas jannaschiana VP2]